MLKSTRKKHCSPRLGDGVREDDPEMVSDPDPRAQRLACPKAPKEARVWRQERG